MKSLVLACLGWMAGSWILLRATAAEPAPAAPPAADAAALAPFQDELSQTDFPSHVAGLAVVEAKVTAVAETFFCPMRTAQCGPNPTCNHPKRIRRTCSLAIIRTLANPSGLNVPASFDNVQAPENANLKAGQAVCASFYAYRNGVPPQISRIVPAPEAPPAP